MRHLAIPILTLLAALALLYVAIAGAVKHEREATPVGFTEDEKLSYWEEK